MFEQRAGTVEFGTQIRLAVPAGQFARLPQRVVGEVADVEHLSRGVEIIGRARAELGSDTEAMAALARIQGEVGYDKLLYDDKIGKVSLIGAGMRSHPGVTATFFSALASAGVNIEMISTSEIRISVVTRADQLDGALSPQQLVDRLRGDGVVALLCSPQSTSRPSSSTNGSSNTPIRFAAVCRAN